MQTGVEAAAKIAEEPDTQAERPNGIVSGRVSAMVKAECLFINYQNGDDPSVPGSFSVRSTQEGAGS
jgi:hypothetical protein